MRLLINPSPALTIHPNILKKGKMVHFHLNILMSIIVTSLDQLIPSSTSPLLLSLFCPSLPPQDPLPLSQTHTCTQYVSIHNLLSIL